MPGSNLSTSRRRARRRLDERLDVMRRHLVAFSVPHGGWVAGIREALGMTRSDLARRMGVAPSTVARLEANERAGTIQLDTLRRAAAELDCELVYALVPRRPLEGVVLEQARKRATAQIALVEHTMLLEDQVPSQSALQGMIDDSIAEIIDRPGLWND
jgi:predicted DNA-binding mobile mystery protein A